MDILKTLANSGLVDQLAGQFGLDANQVESILEKGLPKITNQISKNTSDQSGLESFTNALNDHKDKDVNGMINNLSNINALEGGKILDHIFGSKKSTVEDEISSQGNVSQDKVDSILKYVAPIVMALVAKKVLGQRRTAQAETRETTQTQNDRAAAPKSGIDLDKIYRERQAQTTRENQNTTENTKSGIPGILSSIFDKDNDGSILDDLLGR